MHIFEIQINVERYGKAHDTIHADGYRVEPSGAISFFNLVKKEDGDDLEWTDEENIESYPNGSWYKVKRV